MPKVKAALAQLSSDEVKAFKATGSIDVAGQTLTTGDLTVSASVDFSGSSDHHGGMGDRTEAREDAELIVVLDIRSSPELVLKGLSRGFLSSVQQLRKKAGLKPSDDVDLFYAGASERMVAIVDGIRDVLFKETRCVATDASQKSASATALVHEEVEIGDEKVVLSLCSKP